MIFKFFTFSESFREENEDIKEVVKYCFCLGLPGDSAPVVFCKKVGIPVS